MIRTGILGISGSQSVGKDWARKQEKQKGELASEEAFRVTVPESY